MDKESENEGKFNKCDARILNIIILKYLFDSLYFHYQEKYHYFLEYRHINF